MPAVHFGRAGFPNSFLSFGDNLNYYGDKTLIFVSKADLAVDFGMVLTKTLETSDGWEFRRWNNLDRWQYLAYPEPMNAGASSDVDYANWHINSIVVDQTSGTASFYVDGVSKGTDVSLSGSGAGTSSSGEALLGARNSGSPNHYGSYYIAYLLMFNNNLGSSDRGQVEDFLSARFGL